MNRIILNEYHTEYFECPIGVKQGDCLSPTLFSIFINDLAVELKSANLGVKIDHENEFLVSLLLYADDIVLLTENEVDMQTLISLVETWCRKWQLELNLTKTNIMHIRRTHQKRSNFWFLFNQKLYLIVMSTST